jgi:hypothetical protein
MLKQFLTAQIAARAVLLALAFVTTPAAADTSSFDGSWSVKIITQRGSCNSGASLPIRVTHGSVASDVVKVSGQVGSSGMMSVNVGDGLKRASGVGRLSDQTGSGTWKGGPCSGIWTAQKN